jgi:uncharacterized protein
MTAPSGIRRLVTCPGCRGDSLYAPENPFRPFCSERCKNADFGAWASESYRLDAKPPAPEDDDPDAPHRLDD